jgi:O-methyltransferase
MKQIRRYVPHWIVRAAKLILRPSHTALLPGPVTYEEDGLATMHNASFQTDPTFSTAYTKALATGSWSGIAWRAHVVAWAARQCMHVPGDFVECGVNRGGYSRLIVDYVDLRNSTKKFFLLDTFAGLVPKYLTEEERQRGLMEAYQYTECYEAVKLLFSDVPNVVIVKGAVPDTLPQITSKSVAFVSIDMNCVEPEIAAATFLWDRLSPGGTIVLDDYGHPLHIAQKQAFDKFAAEHGVAILSLPTAQGIIVKPHTSH